MESKLKTPLRPFHEALCGLIDNDITTVKECAAVLGVTTQSVRNWCAERTEISERDAHLLMRQHPNATVRRELANSRISGSEFFPPETAVGDTDVNRDGRTDEQDALLALAAVATKAAQELEMVAGEITRGLSDGQKQQITHGLYSLREQVNLTIGIISKTGRKGARR